MPRKRKPSRTATTVAATGVAERKDMVRYAFLVGFGILVCAWMWHTQPVSGRAAFLYIVMAAGSLAGYGIFRLVFPKLKPRG